MNQFDKNLNVKEWNDFATQFKNRQDQNNKMFKTFSIAWIVWVVVCLCMIVGIVYTAINFLDKV